MKATLIDVDGAFEIVSLSSSEQFIPYSTFSQWNWDVMPTKMGITICNYL